MFSKLSLKTKQTILFSLVGLMFVVALIIGNQDPEPEPEQAPDETVETIAEPVEEVTVPEVRDYDSVEDAEAAADPIALPSDEDKTDAANVAWVFIREFHSVDANAPLDYLERARPYMTERLYKDYEGIPKRGTLTAQTATAIDYETAPVELEDKFQVWAVYISSRETASDGTVNVAFNAYSVMLVKEGDEWLVDGVRADE